MSIKHIETKYTLTLVLSTSKGVVSPLAQAPANAPAMRYAGGADASRDGPMNLRGEEPAGGRGWVTSSSSSARIPRAQQRYYYKGNSTVRWKIQRNYSADDGVTIVIIAYSSGSMSFQRYHEHYYGTLQQKQKGTAKEPWWGYTTELRREQNGTPKGDGIIMELQWNFPVDLQKKTQRNCDG